MTQREKLIDIMAGSPVISIASYESTRELADYLIANGVVVLPCRCKDCKYFDGEPGQPNIQCSQMHEDDFCSYGVRKGDE